MQKDEFFGRLGHAFELTPDAHDDWNSIANASDKRGIEYVQRLLFAFFLQPQAFERKAINAFKDTIGLADYIGNMMVAETTIIIAHARSKENKIIIYNIYYETKTYTKAQLCSPDVFRAWLHKPQLEE